MGVASLAELDAISEELRKVEEAVPRRWSAALVVDRKADSIRVRASDWEVLLRALSSTDVLVLTSGSDPLANARLRGIHAKRRLVNAEGGAISASEVAQILGISRQAVDKRRQAGTLLAIRVGGHGYRYPFWQFEQSGVLGGLEPVLKALARHDEWMKLAFFVNANVHLNDESPLHRLRRGDVETVLQAAEAYGEHGAA